MNVFYPSGSNIETNAFESNAVNPQTHKISPESWDICLTENYPHLLKHGTAALFWVNGYIKYPIFKNTVMQYSFEYNLFIKTP